MSWVHTVHGEGRRTHICKLHLAAYGVVCLIAPTASAQQVVTESAFKDPLAEYRPVAQFRGAGGGAVTGAGTVSEQLKAIYDRGYGGVMFAPTAASANDNPGGGAPSPPRHTGYGLRTSVAPGASPWVMIAPPGTTGGSAGYAGSDASIGPAAGPPQAEPAYLSQEYFDRVKEILAYSKERGRKAVFYDEVRFPSGMANHTTPKSLYRKRLDKSEEAVTGPRAYAKAMPERGVLMAVVALNTKTLQRIDLTPRVQNGLLSWRVPAGEWRVMIFNCITMSAEGGSVDYSGVVDYLDPDAVKWFLDTVYEPHSRQVGEYFGNTLNMTFFDDVGIYNEERTWTPKFNARFKARIGMDPAVYYPSLWEDIGPETEAARVAFFDTRAELLADGFPKTVAEWGAKHNLPVSGHCPGNYEIGPVDMNGDPFKFYRAQPIPMADVIFAYPFGRDGLKLISDGADLYDKPIVAAETFNSFAPAGLPAGYRRVMELYIRGINRPMATSGNGPSSWADWLGRNSMLLQGGRRVSEIAIFFPIAALEAHFHFDAVEYPPEMRVGTFVPYETDYLAIGEMLLNQVHRDYTLLPPEVFLSDRIKLKASTLELDNQVNRQSFKVLILPGERVISLKALQRIKAYYDGGGAVLATSLLPSKAAELAGSDQSAQANDSKVRAIIREMFGIDPGKPMPSGASAVNTNARQGKAVFIQKPDPAVLSEALGKLGLAADVVFAGNPSPSSGGGAFSYVHKKKEGRDIYFFANSSDDAINTFAEVRGRLQPQLWDPSTGDVAQVDHVEHIRKDGRDYTRFPLKLEAINSVFVVGTI